MSKIKAFFKSDKYKQKIFPEVQRTSAVVFFTFIYGFGVAWFLEASVVPLYTGGIPGVGQLIRDALYVWFQIEVHSNFLGLFVIIINIPVLLIGWFGVSHRFTIYSIISVVIQAFILSIIPSIDMGLAAEEHALAAAVLGGLLVGIGTGGALKYGTSTGGFDILAQYFSFRKGKSVGFFSMVMNIAIAIFGGLIVNYRPTVPGGIAIAGGVVASYTIIRIIISTIVTDRMHTSYHFLSVDIITENPQILVYEILNKVYRGVTLMKVEGAYSHHEKTLVYVIISSYELHALVGLVKSVDQKAFIVTRPVRNVFGNFKRKAIA